MAELRAPLPPSGNASSSSVGPVAHTLPYLSPSTPFFGLPHAMHASLFGGVALVGDALVPQYNFAAYAHRQLLWAGRLRRLAGPRLAMAALPLPDGMGDVEERRGGCLLAARARGESKIDLWIVNERSRRKKLEAVTVKARSGKWKVREEEVGLR